METVETEETLNYDFNFNMVLAKSLISKLSLRHERDLATHWLQKLSTGGTTMEELQLRNMFTYFLLLSLQEGQLRPPFDAEPPAAPLPTLEHLLPSEAYDPALGVGHGDDATSHERFPDSAGSAGSAGPPYEYSPDKGEFLAAQPVPRCGAFCYLAVVARQDQ